MDDLSLIARPPDVAAPADRPTGPVPQAEPPMRPSLPPTHHRPERRQQGSLRRQATRAGKPGRDLATRHRKALADLARAGAMLADAEARLQASAGVERLLREYLLSAVDGVWQTDAEHRFVSTTTDLEVLGVAATRVIGRTAWDVAGGDVEADPNWQRLRRCFEARLPLRGFEYCLRDDHGAVIWREVNGNPIFGADGAFRGYRGSSRDITPRKLTEARITWLADHDCLTGLLNRRAFLARVAEAVQRCPPGSAGGALLLIDLDNFKDVNDTAGHDAGDVVLAEVARRCTAVVGPQDAVARLGGDEFAVHALHAGSAAAAAELAARLREALCRPIVHAGQRIRPAASFGLALLAGRHDNIADVLKEADLALYAGKGDGGDRVRVFEPAMRTMLERRLALADELRLALERDEFRLAFQPLVGLADGEHSGFEVLLRWQHPERGLLSPGTFIDCLEASGLIVPVGSRVLDQALSQLRAWQDAGLSPGHLGINLAADQLRTPHLAAELRAALDRHGLEPAQLRIEIVENTILQPGSGIYETLREIRQEGIAIALDDFGTGFASLSHIKQLPLDILKIDRSFVGSLIEVEDDRIISQAIIRLAHGLGLRVVAEGVESAEVAAFLHRQGCDEIQGYHIARPLAAAEATAYLRAAATRSPAGLL